jgi:hypothetical protein
VAVLLHGTDLIAIAAIVAAGFAVCYAFLLWKLRSVIKDRQLRVADQIGALDEAIRALETRLAEQQISAIKGSRLVASPDTPEPATVDSDPANQSDEGAEIAPDIQAAIAAATVATLGANAVVQSVKAVPSPWTQQGRVLVQGGHNLRVRR